MLPQVRYRKSFRMRRLVITTVLIMASLTARAELFSFYGITANDPSGASISIGESQLSMDVTVLSATTASLVVANPGPEMSSVAKICFDYSGIADINLALVSTSMPWTYDASGQLPGADGMFNSDFCVKAIPPPSQNGITPATSPLEIILSYDAGSFDILAALGNADFRVGLHLTDVGAGGQYSESFINNIPEPSTTLLLGFVALAGKFYRKIFCV